MRRPLVALSAGALALASACATSTGSLAGTRIAATPSAEPRQPTAAERDSIAAQAIADREGPRVDVRAEIMQGVASRMVRGAFRVDDDSYVLVGQVDASGTVRIVFPSEPQDDGFVRGKKSYQTAEFFAGFNDQFHYRFANYARYYGYRPDSYDAGVGYLFIIASWRPMRVDKFSTNGTWDSFELADEASLRDPKPAIYELAELLAGENREAYTVKFAKYSNTIDYTPYGLRNAYGLCSGYGSMGWSQLGFFNPFGVYSLAAMQMFGYGYDFTYRGTRYLYSQAGDCYYAQPLYFGNPFTIAATTPVVPTAPATPKWTTGGIRPPGTPRFPPGRLGPVIAQDANPQAPSTSPAYRNRGLLTDDDGSGNVPARRGPRTDPLDRGITRPALQQMVQHHLRDANDNASTATPAFRGHPTGATGATGRWSSATRTDEPRSYNPPRERPAVSGYSGGNSGSARSSGGGYSGARSAPSDVSRSPSSSSSGGSVSGGGASSSGSSSSGSSRSSGSSVSGSSSSAGGSSIKPKQ